MRRGAPLIAGALLAAAAALAPAQPVPEHKSSHHRSDWELEQDRRSWKEGELKLPAYPGSEGLIEFLVSGASSFRFFIDAASLSLGADGVVRYTMIARSRSGVTNVSYEGIRCATSSYKVFALGADGRWASKESAWRAIEPKPVQRWHIELRSRYFCPNRGSIASVAEGLDALRRGGHPAVAAKAGF